MPLSPHLQKLMDEAEAEEAKRKEREALAEVERQKRHQETEERLRKAQEAWEAGKPERERMEREEAEAREAQMLKLVAEFEPLLDTFVYEHLERIGLSPTEARASISQVPEAIRKAIPVGLDRSFGLVGGFGIGKTFGLAAVLQERVRANLAEQMKSMTAGRKENDIWRIEVAIKNRTLGIDARTLWVNWCGEITRRRGQLFANNNREVEEWVLKLMDPRRPVFLDDIGAEKKAGNDWAGETLERIIDERGRNQCLTIWTSNLNSAGMIERYGPRLYSRLEGMAPAIQLPALKDRRIRKAV